MRSLHAHIPGSDIVMLLRQYDSSMYMSLLCQDYIIRDFISLEYLTSESDVILVGFDLSQSGSLLIPFSRHKLLVQFLFYVILNDMEKIMLAYNGL